MYHSAVHFIVIIYNSCIQGYVNYISPEERVSRLYIKKQNLSQIRDIRKVTGYGINN